MPKIQAPRARELARIQYRQPKDFTQEILAVQGQNPLATAISTTGDVIGKALTKRAELRKQGEKLARLEQLAGKEPGAFKGLDDSTATSLATQLVKDKADNYTPAQLKALYGGDPAAISGVFPSGTPQAAASLSATIDNREENRRLRGQQQDALKTERDLNRIDKRSKEKADIVSTFNADPGVRRIKSSIDGAANVRELATSGNPIAAAAIPTYMARASGEVGNLSEADKAPFGGSRAILQRMEASLKQMASGQLTEDNRKFLLDLSDIMEQSAVGNLDRRATEVSGQYGEASQFLTADEIRKTLRPITPPKPKAIPTPGAPTLRWNAATSKVEPY